MNLKIKSILGLMAFSMLVFSSCTKNTTYPDGNTSFNDNWKFAPRTVTKKVERTSDFTISTKQVAVDTNMNVTQKPFIDFQGCEKPNYDDSKWQTVNIPHDMAIAGKFSPDNASLEHGAWLPNGNCVYRKHFTISNRMKNKRIEIYFDGVYRNSKVYLNGHLLGYRPFGYISFHYDMTPYINYGGKNVLTVEVDNTHQPGARWYTGTGIYRNVKLKISGKLYIPTWKNYMIANHYDSKFGYIKVKTNVKNATNTAQNYILRYTVKGGEGEEIAIKKTKLIKAIAGCEDSTSSVIKVPHAQLWSPEHPYLYTVTTEILQKGRAVYKENTKVGIRTMTYTADKGLILNGKKVTMKGVCLHNCGGPIGAAVERRTLERQFDYLKEMGVNAIRTSHNPFSTEFMNLCDEKGFLVMDEMFDMWTTPKPGKEHHVVQVDYYVKEFKKWSGVDLQDFILRDRNHPCVAMWSIGNEIREMFYPKSEPIQRRLEAIVHANDYRPVTNAVMGYGWNHWPNDASVVQNDILGYNYISSQGLDKEAKLHPNKPKVITECSSAQPYFPRSTFFFGNDKEEWYKENNIDEKQQDQMNKNTGNTNSYIKVKGLDTWRAVVTHPNVIGQFIWTGFDYLGETSPYNYPARSSSFAPFDLAGNKKSNYYFYKSQWSKVPVVHIIPTWNFKGHEGQPIPVLVYTNGTSVELFLNGHSQGIRKNKLSDVTYQEWKVKYAPGELVARAYKNGQTIASDTVWTTSKAINISLAPYNTEMRAGGHDLIYVTCNLLDAAGHTAVTANNKLHFEVEGPAVIAGMGNGDNQCIEPFQGDNGLHSVTGSHSAFHGKVLVVLKSINEAGNITLRVSGDNLKTEKIKLYSYKL